jgi:hypothetical protein
MRVGVLGCAILVGVAVLGGAGVVSAGTCGGLVPCQCGDVVTADYAMTHDLGHCPGHGLVVRSNVTLDCRGFGLVGLGNGSEQYGVYLTTSTERTRPFPAWAGSSRKETWPWSTAS